MNLIKFIANKNLCESCIVTKQKIESHNNLMIFDKHFLNLMWSDLVQFFIFNNKIKYFVIFLRDIIKRSMIYVLRVKLNTFDVFRHFQQHNEHEDNRVRRFRIDWEKKYFSEKFDNYCFEHDIEWKLIVSETSKQYEVIERLRQIFMSMINIIVFNLTQTHWQAVKRIFRYLRKTYQMKLIFRETLRSLEDYTNSNCTENQNIRRSISKYVFNVNSEIIN
jgi:hypothetical protein